MRHHISTPKPCTTHSAARSAPTLRIVSALARDRHPHKPAGSPKLSPPSTSVDFGLPQSTTYRRRTNPPPSKEEKPICKHFW